jgi:cytoskeleton protein RodZ
MAEIELSLGGRLRQARETRKLSLEKVSQETHIRLSYLQAIEDGNLDTLPSEAQARGFMRAYASFLDLDLNRLLADLPREPSNQSDEAKPDPGLETEETSSSAESSQAIFVDIGKTLARQRELLGFSLSDVERQTHLRVHNLVSLEAGEFDLLPSPVQGRGMLSNYASFLGLDPDLLLLRYADGLQVDLAARRPDDQTRPRRPDNVSGGAIRRIISTDMIFGGLLIFLLAVFIIWGIGRISNLQNQEEPAPTSLSIGGALLNTPTNLPVGSPPAPTSSPVDELPAQGAEDLTAAELPPAGEGAVQVYIIVHQRAWVRVLVDGEVSFSGRVLDGAALPFSGDESVEILTGDGLALEVYYNQENLGRMGFYGEVVDMVYGVDGVFTPTPTPSPTPTPTPRTSATPIPTGTEIAE